MSSISPDSPRRIEWTGERCVPWADDLQVIYEHYQRYLFVAPLARGKRVLDLASGEGYGTSILASEADLTIGIDIDDNSVLHATQTYSAPNLSFEHGDMLDLARYGDASFDLIVCFEAIAQVDDHETLLSGVRRILRSDGVFVVSTPDRLTYTDQQGQANPFHVHELSQDELIRSLSSYFSEIRMWGQNVSIGALLTPLDFAEGTGQVATLTRDDDRWTAGTKFDSTYLIAIASNNALPDLPSYSTLIDTGLELVRQSVRQRNSAIQERDKAVQIGDDLLELESEALGMLQRAQTEISQLRNREAVLRDRIEAGRDEARRLYEELDRVGDNIARLAVDRATAEAAIVRITSSRQYRIGQYLYSRFERLLPPGARAALKSGE